MRRKALLAVVSLGAVVTLVLAGCSGGRATPSPTVVNFSAANTQGAVPLTVQFRDETLGDVVGWAWNFGDGSSISTERNPHHTYVTPGVFDVTLAVTSASGTRTITKGAFVRTTASVVTLPPLTPSGADVIGAPTLTASVASSSITPGEETILRLTLDTAPTGLAGFDIGLVFTNGAVVQATSVEFPAFGLTDTIPETFPTPTLRIKAVDVLRSVSPGATNILLATVRVKGLNTGTTIVALTPFRLDDDAGDAFAVAIVQPTIDVTSIDVPASFTMALESRFEATGPSWVTAYQLDLYVAGANPFTSTPFRSYTGFTDETGSISLLVPTGVYDVRGKGSHSLRVLSPNVTISDGLLLDLGVQLEGDTNGDNVVDAADYSAILLSFGQLVADLDPEKRNLDFNQDGVIDSVDYSLLLRNFGLFGEPPFN